MLRAVEERYSPNIRLNAIVSVYTSLTADEASGRLGLLALIVGKILLIELR